MQEAVSYPSASSNGINGVDRTFVDPFETLGTPSDSPATAQNSTNTAFALAKGILAGLGAASGSADVDTNDSARINHDMPSVLGNPEDSAAFGPTDSVSAIALLKGLLAFTGV